MHITFYFFRAYVLWKHFSNMNYRFKHKCICDSCKITMQFWGKVLLIYTVIFTTSVFSFNTLERKQVKIKGRGRKSEVFRIEQPCPLVVKLLKFQGRLFLSQGLILRMLWHKHSHQPTFFSNRIYRP